MIEINDLTFRYRGASAAALEQLSLSVRDGSLFGLLGPNGSGKTTLISILAGVLPVPRGRVSIGGRELMANRRAIQAAGALVPQDYAFYPALTVSENLDFFAGVQGIPRAVRRARIHEALEIAGLENAGALRAERLSGGMKRRLNIAVGLLNQPRLLLLDEPTVGIDPQSRRFILESIRRINAAGTTVVYTSHYMEEVEALCDDIGILDAGRLVARGTLRELLSRAGGKRLHVVLADSLTDPQQQALAEFTGLRIGESWLELDDCPRDGLERMLQLLRANGAQVAAARYGENDLEELFLSLTRHQLRDG